ncbi:hypothetical protein [Desulforamulus hydrothermalis]|nr:hypothetical protein [Desulforamulus hydrothermalis]
MAKKSREEIGLFGGFMGDEKGAVSSTWRRIFGFDNNRQQSLPIPL